MTAQDKRFAGIKAVGDKFCVVEKGTRRIEITGTREEIIAEIEKLTALGRTERWHTAVKTWAVMVQTEEDLQWAFLQGQIYTAHNA